jgi:hypothetical protein
MTAEDLRQNMLSTYFHLRLGIVVFSAALPWLLVGYSLVAHGEFKENSMSAFYGAYGGAMRDYFVGILWAVGSFLVLYKGFSVAEDWALNGAGACAVLLSVNPCYCWTGVTDGNDIHATFAISFFLCMIYVCWFCAYDTISLLPKNLQTFYEQAYRWIGWALVVTLGAALVVHVEFPDYHRIIFLVEASSVTIFAGYWATKSAEFRVSAAEARALRGEVEKKKDYGLVEVAKPQSTF